MTDDEIRAIHAAAQEYADACSPYVLSADYAVRPHPTSLALFIPALCDAALRARAVAAALVESGE